MKFSKYKWEYIVERQGLMILFYSTFLVFGGLFRDWVMFAIGSGGILLLLSAWVLKRRADIKKHDLEYKEHTLPTYAEPVLPPQTPALVLFQEWSELERGWGSRPDGYSVHLSEEDRRQYIKEYWDSMPAAAPDEYSRPIDQPRWRAVSPAVYVMLEKKRPGLRLFQSNLDMFIEQLESLV